jgi:hypothetical protein
MRYGGKPMRTLTIVAIFAACTSLLFAQKVTSEGSGSTSQWSSLSLAAQAGISEAIGADGTVYAVHVSEDGLVARNPGQKLEMRFSAAGAEIGSGDSRLSLRAIAFGYGNDLKPWAPVAPRAERNRVEFRRDPISEWYVNGPLGLEQGFTVERAPGHANGQPLTVALTIAGDFQAVAPDRTSLTLSDRSGRARLRYRGLSAQDAMGKALPAWLELHGSNLLLRVNDAGAHYPVLLDPWVQLAELTSSDGVGGDEFGFAVAVNGNTVVVGASQFNSTQVGAAYVFVKGSTGWANMTQTAKLTASDAAAGAQFGSSVAFAGAGTVVVGAPHAAVGTNQNQGKAYVFVKPTTGWKNMTETARLTASDGASGDYFGYSVSGIGNAVVVGAPQASSQAQFQGAAYVFVKPGSGWKTTSTFKAKLTASNGKFDEGFGVSVSLSSNTLVAGAPQANSGKGGVYVYVKPSTGWQTTSSFNAELTASDGQSDDLLGNSVSISNTTVVAGAYLATIGANRFQGAAYVFVEPTSGWADATETAKLTAPDGQSGDEFGYSVSISGNKVVAGASNDPSTNAAYVFVKPASGWATTSKYNAKLTAAGSSIFGFSVGTNGGTIVAGAIGNLSLQGAAYVFGP